MTKQKSKFKFTRALKHDYALLGAAIFSIILLGFSGYMIFSNDMGGLYIFGSLDIIFIILLFIRYHILKSYFNDGVDVKGVIVKIWFYKDRGRVNYTYQIEDKTYIKGLAIMKTKETSVLSKGMSVNLLVKKDNHKKAIIKDLFI